MSRQRERKSISSTTMTGVPYSLAILVRLTPAILTPPSRMAVRGQTAAGSLLKVGALKSGVWVMWVLPLHLFRRGDAEEAEGVGDDLAGGGGQR